jgi:GcrA cell cycle regulator
MTGWTDEWIKILTHMWADASNSASQIGAEIGVTKNAVIGMRKRLGLPERRSGRPVQKTEAQEAKPQKPKPSSSKRFFIPPSRRSLPKFRAHPQPHKDAPAPRMLDLVDLTERTCKWPVTNETPIKFCGHEKACGVPYCEFHQRRASAKAMSSN